MSNEFPGKLIGKIAGDALVWTLTWVINNKPDSRNQTTIYGSIPEKVRSLKASDYPLGLNLDVVFVFEAGRPKIVGVVDAAFNAEADRKAAQAKAEADRKAAEAKAEAEKAAIAKAETDRLARAITGTPFLRPAPWGVSGKGNHFHNPYNFIPTPEGQFGSENALAHRAPAGHHAYHPGTFSGSIDVELTVVTPLIVSDSSGGDKDPKKKHVTVGPLKDASENPLIPITSLKGVLRSAYEAITMSRMGVLGGSNSRSDNEPPPKLARRMNAREGLWQVPLRVTDETDGFEVLLGSHSDPDMGKNLPQPPDPTIPQDGTMYAAWLPRYDAGHVDPDGPRASRSAVRCRKTGRLPQHLQRVACKLQKMEKWDRNKKGIFEKKFFYWKVIDLIIEGNISDLGIPPNIDFSLFDDQTKHRPTKGADGKGVFKDINGYVSISNQNIGGKHDERVFFSDQRFVMKFPESGVGASMQRWKSDWSSLISSYKSANEREMNNRVKELDKKDSNARKRKLAAFVKNKINGFAYSRHLIEEADTILKPGDLLYGRFKDGVLIAIYPVMIARELGDYAPIDVVPETLKPATRYDDLSPADRVFGWVNQGGTAKDNRNMVRGQLRIASLKYESHPKKTPISDFSKLDGDKGLPLAILSTPKPQQARFYLAADKNSSAQANGQKADSTFYKGSPATKGLRGRKVFPHHRHTTVAANYWDGPAAIGNPAAPVLHRGRNYYREYIRQGKTRDDQNRSIKGWINPETVFKARIEVINLNAAELGALLWLLNLPDGHFLRMGFGKPLGFGSVRAKVTGVNLADGAAIRSDYVSLLAAGTEGIRYTKVDDIAVLVEAYKTALSSAFKDAPAFETLEVIKAFLATAAGFEDGLPLHYPRAHGFNQTLPNVPPNSEGKNFEWFVANNKEAKVDGPRLVLPPLWAETGLPYLLAEKQK